MINHAKPIAPTVIVPHTSIADQPAELAVLKPYNNPPKPIVDNPIESISILASRFGRTSSRFQTASNNDKTAIGRIILNSTLQSYCSTIHPDKDDPLAGVYN